MAQAHLHQYDGETIVAEFSGVPLATVKALITDAMDGPSSKITVIQPGAGRVNIKKSDIRDIIYRP